MSELHVYLDKLEQIIPKIDEFIEKKASDPELSFSNFRKEVIATLRDSDDEYEDFIKRLSESNSETEVVIIQDFKSYDAIKKNIIIKMLEIVVALGKIENHMDLEKQVYWWEKLKSA